LNDELFRRFVRDLVEDLQQVSGASLEKLLVPLWGKMAGGAVQANGLNLQGAPVSGALDAIWPDGSVSEASSDKDYFDNKEKKLRHDIRHVRKAAPHVHHVRMFSTRTAGPAARTRQDRRRARYARLGFTIDVNAGQDIADYIVRECLLDEVLVKRIAPILPNLQRITEQFAASQRLPDLAPAFRGRDTEIARIIAKLKTEHCVVISGLGGIGKTELACAVAHAVREDYEQVIWIDAAPFERADQLSAFDVRSNGYELNVLGILRSQSALVVLDNVTVDLDLDALAAHCGAKSNMVLTSQAKWGPSPVSLEELDRSDAAAILSGGTATPCPDAILDQVLAAVGAHPLLLRILNRLVVETGAGWNEVVAECAHLPHAVDERRQTVAQRIVRRNLAVLDANLAPFVWAQSASLDAGFAKHMVGRIGLAALERWAFLARGQADTVRLHDIVYACASGLRAELRIDLDAFRDRLKAYLRGAINPKGIEFVRVARRHRALLARLLTEQPEPGVLRYAYLHSVAPRELAPTLIGDPATDVANGPVMPVREWVLSIVEAIESSYRRTRDRGQKDRAKQDLKAHLALFDVLRAASDIDAQSKITIRHHHAKSLLKLGEADAAEREFDAIVSAGEGNYPSRLQLARLLKKDPARAKALILEIIEAEEKVPGTVQITTLIETLATLRRSHLRGFTSEVTKRFGPFMAQVIKAAAWSGETQPVQAFAAVGPDWSYLQPTLFREVFEEIDLGSPASAEDDDERVAVGRICIAARKMYLRQSMVVEADAALARALEFFRGLKSISPFAAVHFADALLQAENPLIAGEILDNVREEKRDAFWHLRRAEAILGSDGANGVGCIDRGIALLKAPEYRATFLAVKAELLHKAADPDDVTVLGEAIACCTSDQYRADLRQKLDGWMASAP
jgi:hypothetical protein